MPRRAARMRRIIAAVSTAVVITPLLPVTAPAAAAGGKPAMPLQHAQSIAPVRGGPAKPRPTVRPVAPADKALPPPRWPAAGSSTATRPGRGRTRVGTLPVYVSSRSGRAGSVEVEVIDHAASEAVGVPLLLRVRSDDPDGLAVTVDYSGFASAYGADWASRLRLAQLPSGCTDPAAEGCAPVAVATTNDGTSVSAEVRGGRTTVALTASASGGDGDYGATPLNPSGAWTAGGNSGGFTWSYDMRVPPSLGGPVPSVRLAYSSQAVDGETAATNNQPSWIGDGFGYQPGSIVRRYVTCADDMGTGANNGSATGDQCWKTDNATLTLNGQSSELIYNATDGQWHMRSETGWRITRGTGASNGDNNGENWIVTTTDGTKYFFGLNRLPGYTGTAPANKATNSVFTVPVYGNHSGEPCHATAFASSSCAQAWQWNLDYVQDTHGNTESFWYAQQTNKYGAAGSATTLAQYVRGGYLTRIDYGTTNRSGTDTDETSASAPMTVVFQPDNRCLSGCSTHDGTHYPDTPWDQVCTASPCPQLSPSFWIDQRLKSVTTRVLNGSAYRDVEQWTLTHSFPDPGDGTRRGLWLASIAHSGLAGGSAPVPAVTFQPTPMNNRVDTALKNGLRPMNWPRLTEIDTETGAKIIVSYSLPECVAGSNMPSAPDTNTKRCFPVRWTPPDLGTEILDYFHKYVVTKVEEDDATDTTPGAQSTITNYTYLGTPAWHYADDDGLTKAKYRTWSQWRGYATVQTTSGTGTGQTLTKDLYFRGMNGDKLSSGTRTATVADSKGLAVLADDDQLAGVLRESTVYNGASAVSGSVRDPWSSPATATRSLDGTTVSARFVKTADTRSWTALDHGRADRWSDVHTDFDAYGLPAAVTDNGDTGRTGDESCALTDYVRNTASYIVETVQEVRKFAMTCAAAQVPGKVFTAADVIADDRTSYDGLAWGSAPAKGDPTKSEALKDWPSASATFLTVGTSGYDVYGRTIDSSDVDGIHTTTAYTPAAGPVTRTVQTNGATGWTTTTDIDPAWGATLGVTDRNSRRTDLAYDPLGRLTSVWLPGRAKASFPTTPDKSYAYAISAAAPSVVTSKALDPNGGSTTSYAIFDALLRPRQTQSAEAGTGGGRIVSDSFYDDAGRAYMSWGPYVATGAPSATLFSPVGGSDSVNQWSRTLFDGAGRAVEVDTNSKTGQLWHSTTAYTGDRTDTTPPAGGVATSAVTDVQGHTVELRQYHGPVATGSTDPSTYDSTTYTYNSKGQLTSYQNPAGTVWSAGYDVRGRPISLTDPDAGTTATAYDDAGRITSTTDARGVTLAYAYADPLHRKTGEFLGSTSGTPLASWAYDQITGGRGMLTTTTRYDASGSAYSTAVTALDAAGRPTTTAIVIPATQFGLAGTYSYTTTYNANGTPHTYRMPAIGGAGGLGVETLTYGYHSLGLPTTLSTTLGDTYVVSTSYTSLGQRGTISLSNNGSPLAQIGDYWEDATGRLSRIWTTRETAPVSVSDLTYHYDNFGNVSNSVQASPVAGAETQCYQTNSLAQLSQAWTPSSGDCAAAPTVAGIGGSPAPYWTTWTIDAAGLRRQQIEHGTPTGDRTTAYAYPAGSHTLTSASATDSTGTHTATYGYANGNTTSRPGPPGTQALTWDSENRLATVTDPGGTTGYLYNADGSQLIRTDPTGKTLFLPGQQIHVTTGGSLLSATRYYQHGTQIVAQRTASGVTWLAADAQGTVAVSIDAAAGQAVGVRRFTPFGGVRGTAPSWPNDKGFVGGTTESGTGLTNLGVREYDSDTGRFVSPDPQFDQTDPQSWNAYAYADNAPVTKTDPDGRMTRSGPSIPCADDGPCGTNTVAHPDGAKSGHSNDCPNQNCPLPPPPAASTTPKPGSAPKPEAKGTGCQQGSSGYVSCPSGTRPTTPRNWNPNANPPTCTASGYPASCVPAGADTRAGCQEGASGYVSCPVPLREGHCNSDFCVILVGGVAMAVAGAAGFICGPFAEICVPMFAAAAADGASDWETQRIEDPDRPTDWNQVQTATVHGAFWGLFGVGGAGVRSWWRAARPRL